MPTDTSSVAILADIHGNLRALEAVLESLKQHSTDAVVFAGDLVMNGPHSARVLEVVRQSNHPAVIGNTDREVLGGTDRVSRWTGAQLGGGASYLRALPLCCRLTPPGRTSPGDDLLIVHATPRSCDDLLILEPHPLGTTFTRPTPTAEAVKMLNGERADLIVFGHAHYASAGTVAAQRLASVGSVGFPFDGDPRAAYALAVWEGRSWQLEHHRVAYDVKTTIDDLRHSEMPFRGRYIKMLREANWFPKVPTHAEDA